MLNRSNSLAKNSATRPEAEYTIRYNNTKEYLLSNGVLFSPQTYTIIHTIHFNIKCQYEREVLGHKWWTTV